MHTIHTCKHTKKSHLRKLKIVTDNLVQMGIHSHDPEINKKKNFTKTVDIIKTKGGSQIQFLHY